MRLSIFILYYPFTSTPDSCTVHNVSLAYTVQYSHTFLFQIDQAGDREGAGSAQAKLQHVHPVPPPLALVVLKRMRKASPDAAKRIASAKRKYRGVKYARPTRG